MCNANEFAHFSVIPASLTNIKIDMKALILFGHGARDARWREPFDRLASLWKAQHPSVLVKLAFLEMMRPSLEEAVTTLVTSGATEVVVVPVFFSQESADSKSSASTVTNKSKLKIAIYLFS